MPESAFLAAPFTVQVAPEALADLRARLRATRWPDAPEDTGWSLGTDIAYLRDLVAYWADGFDWAAQEKALSGLARFRARLDGLGMYHANAEIPAAQQARRTEVPTGFTQFPANISRTPRTWLERITNLVRFTQAPRGGHFAPLERARVLHGGTARLLPPLPGVIPLTARPLRAI